MVHVLQNERALGKSRGDGACMSSSMQKIQIGPDESKKFPIVQLLQRGQYRGGLRSGQLFIPLVSPDPVQKSRNYWDLGFGGCVKQRDGEVVHSAGKSCVSTE